MFVTVVVAAVGDCIRHNLDSVRGQDEECRAQ